MSTFGSSSKDVVVIFFSSLATVAFCVPFFSTKVWMLENWSEEAYPRGETVDVEGLAEKVPPDHVVLLRTATAE